MSVYAVNLADLSNTEVGRDFCLGMLLKPVLGTRPVEAEKRFDGHAVLLECDEERAAAIVEVARKHYKRWQLRFYRSKTGNGGWRRV